MDTKTFTIPQFLLIVSLPIATTTSGMFHEKFHILEINVPVKINNGHQLLRTIQTKNAANLILTNLRCKQCDLPLEANTFIRINHSASNTVWSSIHCTAGSNDIHELARLLACPLVDVNSILENGPLGQTGLTPLCCATQGNYKEAVILLLQYNADPSIRNKNGQLPEDLTTDESIKELLKNKRLELEQKRTAIQQPSGQKE